MKRTWTASEDAYLTRALASGGTKRQVAEALGRSIHSVNRRWDQIAPTDPSLAERKLVEEVARSHTTQAEMLCALVARGLTKYRAKRLLHACGVDCTAAATVARKQARGGAHARGRMWTPEQEARLVQLVREGHTVGAAAAQLGRSTSSAALRLWRMEISARSERILPARRANELSDAVRAEVLKRSDARQSVPQIMAALGLSYRQVSAIRRDARLLKTVVRPPYQELRDALQRYSAQSVAQEYKVSVHVLRQWMQEYEAPL